MENENTNRQTQALEESLALTNVVLDLLKERKRDIHRQWVFMLIMCVSFLVMLVVSEYNNYCDRQELYTQLENTRIDFMEYLDSLEYEYAVTESTVTTTTQEVEGDSAEINNVQGNQYKDNATHNEVGGDE